MESRLTLERCRSLIGKENENLSDQEVLELRVFLTALGNVIVDAYLDLENIDQTKLNPPDPVLDDFMDHPVEKSR